MGKHQCYRVEVGDFHSLLLHYFSYYHFDDKFQTHNLTDLYQSRDFLIRKLNRLYSNYDKRPRSRYDIPKTHASMCRSYDKVEDAAQTLTDNPIPNIIIGINPDPIPSATLIKSKVPNSDDYYMAISPGLIFAIQGLCLMIVGCLSIKESINPISGRSALSINTSKAINDLKNKNLDINKFPI